MKTIKNYLPHIFAFAAFIVISLCYFYPVLQGKQLLQGDIVQYVGMAKEQMDFRNEYNEESYWNNSAFGGMPTYQLGAKYPHNYIKNLDSFIRFLPRPADYLFLYLIGFYVLLCTLRIKPLYAFFGALAFAFSTYLIIIIGAGHNAKAHAIGYIPLLLAGILLVYRKKYIVGGILTAFAAALEIQANHFQMTYYFLLLIAIVSVYFIVIRLKEKDYKSLLQSFGILALAAFLAIGTNATNLLATKEYSQYSTRGKSTLTLNPDGSPKQNNHSLNKEYITEYSYGIFETFNLFSSRIMGGGNREDFGNNSNFYNFLIGLGANQFEAAEYSKNAPGYWGEQPIVVAPAYIGAVVIFLSILALFAIQKRIKYVFLIGILLSIALSWGKNFFLTDIFIEYFPLYDKFRAVASIQVIAELCFPILAFLGVYEFFKKEKQERLSILKNTGIITLGLIVFLFIAKAFLNFQSPSDQFTSQMLLGEVVPQFLQTLQDDRSALYTKDILRTLFSIAIVFAVLYLYHLQKIKSSLAIIIVGCIAAIDLITTDMRYVNNSGFVDKEKVEKPFESELVDQQILEDSTYYRVYNISNGFNSARESFFHQSLGGYHAAKPKKIQELYDYLLAEKHVEPIFNMYNVKYVITTNENGEKQPLLNENANGNAWFVSETNTVNSADKVIEALKTIDTKKVAIFESNSKNNQIKKQYVVDSLAQINLVKNLPNKLVYQSNNSNEGLAVFSENYYPYGWKALIDGRETNIYETDFSLRAIVIPAGKHEITFEFQPEVIQKGSKIALISFISLLVASIAGIVVLFKKRRTPIHEE